MFVKMSLSAKIISGFLILVVLIGIVGWRGISTMNQLNTAIADLKDNQFKKLAYTSDLDSDLQMWVRHILNHVLAISPDEMGAEETGMAAMQKGVDEYLASLEPLLLTEKGKTLTKEIKADFLMAQSAQAKTIALSRAQKPEEARNLWHSQGKPETIKIGKAIAELESQIEEQFEQVDRETSELYSSNRTMMLSIILSAILAGLGIGIFLSRSISAALNVVIGSLSSGSEQVSSASNQVSQSSQQMAEGASQQASSLEETSASLEEMSSMTRQTSDNAKLADAMATETRSAVEKSREAMTRMGEAIGKIKGSSDQTAKIIKTIDEIAFQTNLLALNAAVEAARAGDAGKGFAVVAEEVRNLAQRSAEAAKNTAALIEESQQNANNGVAVSGEVGGILTGIVDSVQKLSQLIGEVSSASQEQTKGIEQIGTAVTEMDKLTQANAANAEESASASEELFAQAKELGEMVAVLVGIVKGAGAGGPDAGMTGSRGRNPAGSFSAMKSASKPASPGAARKTQVPKAMAASHGSHGKDWSPSAQSATANAGRNGHALANGKALKPEQVIPMDDSDLRDF